MSPTFLSLINTSAESTCIRQLPWPFQSYPIHHCIFFGPLCYIPPCTILASKERTLTYFCTKCKICCVFEVLRIKRFIMQKTTLDLLQWKNFLCMITQVTHWIIRDVQSTIANTNAKKKLRFSGLYSGYIYENISVSISSTVFASEHIFWNLHLNVSHFTLREDGMAHVLCDLQCQLQSVEKRMMQYWRALPAPRLPCSAHKCSS